MFIIRQRDIGEVPVQAILNGYGGYGYPIVPEFSGGIVEWVKSHGIFAIPNLRGGGEYGEEWHRAGMMGKKQNVFDDFIAAAEYLITNGYTTPNKLAIRGGSNGGLLCGAVMAQRPDLFRAVVMQIPLLDMIRYNKFQIAKSWESEFGNPDNPAHFPFLFAYSPYHHV